MRRKGQAKLTAASQTEAARMGEVFRTAVGETSAPRGQCSALELAALVLLDAPGCGMEQLALWPVVRDLLWPIPPFLLEITTCSRERWLHRLYGQTHRHRACHHFLPPETAPGRLVLTDAGTTEARRLRAGQPSAFNTGRAGGEKPAHRAAVAARFADPFRVMPDVHANPVIRAWHNSVWANDGTRLWSDPTDLTRPDAVFERANGHRVVLEVEDDVTAYTGIAQLNRYAVRLRREAQATGKAWTVTPVLGVRTARRALVNWGDKIARAGIVVRDVFGGDQ